MRRFPVPTISLPNRAAETAWIPVLVLALAFLCWSAVSAQAEESPSLKWVFSDIQADLSSPVIGPDSTVYVGSVGGGLYAVGPDGVLKWKYQTPCGVDSTPAIGADGTIYFADTEGTFHAITPQGILRWSYRTGSSIRGSPAIGNKGCIYIGCRDRFLYAFRPDGKLQWRCRTGKVADTEYLHYNLESSPVVGPDGTIYAASCDGHLYAITPFGTYKWVLSISYYDRDAAPAIGADGAVYFGSNMNVFYAINPDGSLRWKSHIQGAGYSSPAVAADGTIYLASDNAERSSLCAMNPDGTEKWRYPTDTYTQSSPAIGSDGAIYIGNNDGNLQVLNPDGSLRSQYSLQACIHSCPALAPDGTVYIAAGKLFALQTGNHGYQPGSPWPAFTFTPTRSVMSGDIPEPVMHTVRGQVAMPDSTPLVDVEVSAEGLTTRTDDYGFYSFSLPDGAYTITFHVNSTAIPDSIEAVVDGADVIVDMYPSAKHLVRGRVLGRGGPLVGMSILAGSLTAVTDSEGRFSFMLPDGEHTLELDTGERYFPGRREIVVKGADITVGDLLLHELLWTFAADGVIQGSPCIGRDGTIYLISGQGAQSYLHAVNPDGSSRGKYEIGPGLPSTPALADDGTLYLSTWSSLLAVNPDLTHRWTFPVGEMGVGAAPAIGESGVLYFGSNARVYALNPDGTLRWKYTVGDRAGCTPSIGRDGAVYVPCSNGILYALDPDGTLKWTYKTGGALFFTPVLAADGTIYLNSYDSYFYAVNPDGTLNWKFETGSAAGSGVVLGNDGDIYFVCQNETLFALDPDGTLKWKFSKADLGRTPWIYRPTGEIWAWQGDYPLALNPDGSVRWEHRQLFRTPVAGPGGRLYVTTNVYDFPRTGYLHAIAMVDPDSIVDSVASDGAEGVASNGNASRPARVQLLPNRPNPFNPETTIEFSLSAAARVTVEIYNASGQLVRRLADTRMTAGLHRTTWNGAAHASGVYLVRVRAGNEIAVGKMLMVK